ncbi:hypothetical protein FCULG_00007955 [Fusarium culmorum]|uniref:Uncharacterized protein n=1 Tax=Fusarium culmorum TaxID=5516 RepID=A0A2T4H1Q6_FUSCU|nr:hypothetical protein FCULG_00007955 [Fusarium culmorum]
MGFLDWNDGASVLSTRTSSRRHKSSRSHKKRSRSNSSERGRGFAESIFGGGGSKHNASRASFFGLGGGNSSRSSFFGNSISLFLLQTLPSSGLRPKDLQAAQASPPRSRPLGQAPPLEGLLHGHHALVTGGALTALLARFGLRIPPAIERMLGVASKAATGDSSGLVGEAVRMASGFGGNTSVRMERDTHTFSSGGGDGGGSTWGGLAGMAKKWM